MAGWFRAIALDFDGTLVQGDQPPEEELLAAIGEVRRQGRRVVLVTGRILEELRAVFPGVERWFDAVVAENGAVLCVDGAVRLLAAPVELELDEALVDQGVPFRRGQVLLASLAAHEGEVTEELRRLGLECQLVRNRGELMVLPPGVTKGSGAHAAFAELGVSHHSAVGVGDAENDHSLLRTCELGVAVGNAVGSLKRHADLVLEQEAGAAVEAFLRGPVLAGEVAVEPRRWQIELGRDADGDRVRIPASGINVLIVGRSNSGKSFLAGMLAEQLIRLGYSLCLVDPEGDYGPLGELRGTLHLGGREELPRPESVGRLIEHRFGSVLLDLSFTGSEDRRRYVQPLLEQLERERELTGLPHWIFLDEAHHLRSDAPAAARDKGFCCVTYRPHELAPAVRESIDVILALPGGKMSGGGGDDPLECVEKLWGLELGAWRHTTGREVLIAHPRRGPEGRAFRLGTRQTRHVRHWHKYVRGELPESVRFVFRGEAGEPRNVAGNVGEFHHALRSCEPGVVRHHALRRDLSRWIRDAIQDVALAQRLRALEASFREGPHDDAHVEQLRFDLLRGIEERYVEDGS